MSTDGIFNIIAFIVGLAIGLLQLYYAQHQFEIQQREKTDELRRILTDIQQKLAVIAEVTSQRSFDMQDRLIDLVAGEEAVAEFTEDTLSKVQAVVSSELKKAGVDDYVKRTKDIEKKLSSVLEKSASELVDNTRQEGSSSRVTGMDFMILDLLQQGLSNADIARKLNTTERIVGYRIARIVKRLQLKDRQHLLELDLNYVRQQLQKI